MGIKIYQVDAFTQNPFEGNPAAVCILPEPMEEKWMQKVAMEMNLSETAFLLKEDDGYNLRWFTPSLEVDLCGHATLASAHILWEQGYLNVAEQASFKTKSGLLTANRKHDWIELNFPAEPPEEISAEDKELELCKAIGVNPIYVGKNRMDMIAEIDSQQALINIKPDFESIKKLKARGLIVTCISEDNRYDFISRFFAPAVGVAEDPVTGSAHCCLGPYWKTKLNKKEFLAYQASKRGGTLKIAVNEDNRVIIGGQAVTVLVGELI